ncbi:hypothetical protein [Methylobacterium aquaticum]|uniref:hypothetical protein n=1 Tax=Methylobacterium aquaticum TaxID=270351 RepID=UPI001932AC81|nr:hypothetical protein [Methylobacterium aquaticum]QRE76481.1 hypothetical protein F1D61_25530 [Methylobacterium aquaticum]
MMKTLDAGEIGEVAGAIALAIVETVGSERAEEVIDRWNELRSLAALGLTVNAAAREALRAAINESARS